MKKLRYLSYVLTAIFAPARCSSTLVIKHCLSKSVLEPVLNFRGYLSLGLKSSRKNLTKKFPLPTFEAAV